jgi:uncharacterized OB-fold protein
MMTNCPKCGGTVKPEAKFCPRCAFNLKQAVEQKDEGELQEEAATLLLPQQPAQQPARLPAAQEAPSVPVAEQAASADEVESATTRSCPRCRAAVKPNQKFCMQCAAPLAAGAASSPAQAGPVYPQSPQMQAQAAMMTAQPAAQHAAPYPVPKASAANAKLIVISIIALVVLAGAGVGSYFVFFKGKAETANANVQGNSNRQANSNETGRRDDAPRAGMTPEQTANAILLAMKDNDAEALKKFVARSSITSPGEILTDLQAKEQEKGKVKSFKVNSARDISGTAIVFYTIDWTDGGQTRGTMNLNQEDDAWKLTYLAQL